MNNKSANSPNHPALFNVFSHINKWKDKHWLPYCIITTGCSYILVFVLTYLGESLNLTKRTGTSQSLGLTALGWIIVIAVGIITVINALLTKFSSDEKNDTLNSALKLELETANATVDLYFKLTESTDTICKQKFNRQLKQISDIKEHEAALPEIYTDPCNQLRTINTEMRATLSFILNGNKNRIEADDIYISIAYNFPLESDTWKWADLTEQRGPAIQELLDNPKSTFNKVLSANLRTHGNIPCVFYNSKQDAFNADCYIKGDDDLYDKDDNLLGSIACYKFTSKYEDKKYIQAIVSISTYAKPFCKASSNDVFADKDHPLRKNLDIIMQKYFYRIQVELGNYYVQYLKNHPDRI